MAHKFEALQTAIFEIADSDVWSDAVNEFILHSIVRKPGTIPVDNGRSHHQLVDHCLCGTAIKWNAVLIHTSGRSVSVGTTCILEFMEDNILLGQCTRRDYARRGKVVCTRCDRYTKTPPYCTRCEHRVLVDQGRREIEAEIARFSSVMDQRIAEVHEARKATAGRIREMVQAFELNEYERNRAEALERETKAAVEKAARHAKVLAIVTARVAADLEARRKMVGREAEDKREQAAWYARKAKCDQLLSSLRLDLMKPHEREFVDQSVAHRILAGQDLSEKQAAWFAVLKRRYRA